MGNGRRTKQSEVKLRDGWNGNARELGAGKGGGYFKFGLVDGESACWITNASSCPRL